MWQSAGTTKCNFKNNFMTSRKLTPGIKRATTFWYMGRTSHTCTHLAPASASSTTVLVLSPANSAVTLSIDCAETVSKLLAKVGYYMLKLVWIQDCEECEERVKSVPKHMNVLYCPLRTITENRKMQQTRLFGRGCEPIALSLKLGLNTSNNPKAAATIWTELTYSILFLFMISASDMQN